MEWASLEPTERRARRAYERARVRRSAAAFAPVFLLVAPAALLGHRLSYVVALGVALFAFGVVLLWYGKQLKRAVLPGVAAGVVPLVFALCAYLGRSTMGHGDMTICIAACFVGGILAGVLIDYVYLRSNHGLGFWLAAVSMSLLTGALGCSCAGVFGLAGMAVGLAITTVPALLATISRRRSAG
jgi:hypothetical protein